MWQQTRNGLYKAYSFKDFKQAFAFMERVAELAEKQQHHPRWTNEWNRLEIWLLSHDVGDKITDKDHQLAAAIDKLPQPKD